MPHTIRTVPAGTVPGMVLSAILAGVLLTGCSSTPATGPAPTPAPSATIAADEGGLVRTPTGADSRAAKTTATAAVTAFLDTDAPDWFDQLAPYLTDDARTAYGTVNVARIPTGHVTAAATVDSTVNDFRRTAHVPTTLGSYQVDLWRGRGTDPWQVDTILPPTP